MYDQLRGQGQYTTFFRRAKGYRQIALSIEEKKKGHPMEKGISKAQTEQSRYWFRKVSFSRES